MNGILRFPRFVSRRRAELAREDRPTRLVVNGEMIEEPLEPATGTAGHTTLPPRKGEAPPDETAPEPAPPPPGAVAPCPEAALQELDKMELILCALLPHDGGSQVRMLVWVVEHLEIARALKAELATREPADEATP